MKTIDLSILAQTDKEYSSACLSLKEKYKGDWDDDVHESFRLLLTQIETNQASVHTIHNEANAIKSEVLDLNVEGLCRTANSLCKEARMV